MAAVIARRAIETAIARGNGVVVASMHFGSWEVGLAGWNKMGRKMALLAEVLRPAKLFDRVVGARSAQGVHVIPIDTEAMREGGVQVARRLGAASMREVFKVLRSGGVVAMALDRDLIGNGEPLEFFGQPAPIPIGAVEIAIRAGAAVVPIILFRDRYRVHAVVHPEIRYAPDQPRDAEVRKTAQVLLRIFEQAIREHPEQVVGIDRRTETLLVGVVDTGGDIGRLSAQRHADTAGCSVEALGRGVVADVEDALAHDRGNVHVSPRGHLAGDVNLPRHDQCFDGDPARRVFSEHRIEDGVADLVGDLVGVTLGHGLRAEQAAGHGTPRRGRRRESQRV